MNAILALLLSVALTGPAVPTADVAARIEAEVNRARQLRIEGRVDDAQRRLAALVGSHPTHYRATYNLGLAYAAQGRDAEALGAFARAAELREQQDASDVTIYNTYGWQLLRMGRVDAAIRQFERGVALQGRLGNASRSRLFANHGVALMQARRYDEAEAQFRIAADQYGNTVAKRGLAQIAAMRGENATWAVVFGADRTTEAARQEIQQARQAGIPGGELVQREGRMRGVARFDDRAEAELALEKARSFRKDAYVVRMDSWCNDPVVRDGITICRDPQSKTQ